MTSYHYLYTVKTLDISVKAFFINQKTSYRYLYTVKTLDIPVKAFFINQMTSYRYLQGWALCSFPFGTLRSFPF